MLSFINNFRSPSLLVLLDIPIRFFPLYINFYKLKFYLKSRITEGRRDKEREIFYLSVHSPNISDV